MKKDDENPSLDVDLVTVVQLLYATVCNSYTAFI